MVRTPYVVNVNVRYQVTCFLSTRCFVLYTVGIMMHYIFAYLNLEQKRSPLPIVVSASFLAFVGVLHGLMHIILHEAPLGWIVKFLGVGSLFHYSAVCAIWMGIIAVGVPICSIVAHNINNRVVSRKLFHFLAVILFVPVIVFFPLFITLAFGVGVCALMITEYCRHATLAFPGLSRHITEYYDLFLDKRDRDRGLVLSHIYLLLGIALPFWLHEALELLIVFDDKKSSLVILKHFGWITVGVGDALAAWVGVYWGSFRWPTSSSSAPRRTLEGSAGCFLGMCFAVVLVMWMEGMSFSTVDPASSYSIVVTLFLTTLIEAYSFDIDNLVLPMNACGTYLLLLCILTELLKTACA